MSRIVRVGENVWSNDTTKKREVMEDEREEEKWRCLLGNRIAIVTLEIKIIRMSGRAREEGRAGLPPRNAWEISAC